MKHAWQIEVKQQCNSHHCRNSGADITRHPTSFSLSLHVALLIISSAASFLLWMGIVHGAKFGSVPSPDAKAEINESLNIETNVMECFYECRGNLVVKTVSFFSQKP